MYKSPIEIIEDIQDQITMQFDEYVVNAVHKCGIKVDKIELVKALAYDRKQYDNGYADAKAEIVRCKDCAYGEKLPDNIRCELHDYLPFGYEDFCSMGVKRVTGN